jgi:hypothetical protein
LNPDIGSILAKSGINGSKVNSSPTWDRLETIDAKKTIKINGRMANITI